MLYNKWKRSVSLADKRAASVFDKLIINAGNKCKISWNILVKKEAGSKNSNIQVSPDQFHSYFVNVDEYINCDMLEL